MTPADVLDFWFGPHAGNAETAARQGRLWFGKSPENDRIVAERFGATLVAARAGQLASWAETPPGRLALVIVFDQFPHHIHRDQPLAFATDPQALALALEALALGEDRQLSRIQRVFLYLPLEHAESLALQEQAVACYDALLREAPPEERELFAGFLDYARQHRDVVARFGRFPHRNAILGRPSTPEEIEFLKLPGSRF
ncbi:MAG: DUF924 domain-containing protein [Thiobacillus sp.]|nr:DUF924 domain-containing protein [Thiobacillus sp.]